MKNEYIIINKTALEKRVKELEKEIYEYRDEQDYLDGLMQEYNTIKGILRQSIPLLPEIEKAFDTIEVFDSITGYPDISIVQQKKDYLKNLKLDI